LTLTAFVEKRRHVRAVIRSESKAAC
jgi:hypothetical protein